jgi:hypothetical protein
MLPVFRYFVGTVHLFHPAPEPDLFEVDIPIITQGDNAPIACWYKLRQLI